MISNAENGKDGSHCFAVKKSSALLCRKTPNDYFCDLNCLHCFKAEHKLKCDEKVCKSKDLCGI